MHRFYISPEHWQTNDLVLHDAEAHHARDVLRLKQGDKAVVFDGRGQEITAEIVGVDKHHVRLRKLIESQSPPLRCHISLGQAIPKGKNMDLIIQKAVEIGASDIFPLISERTIVSLTEKEAKERQNKWQQIAIEAAKQCGQNWLPEIHAPQKLKEFFSAVEAAVPGGELSQISRPGRPQYDLCLIGSLQPDAQRLKKILSQSSADHGELPRRVLMLIGPEGDFTPAELALAKSHGCLPITLGPIILRVETAAIYCLSVLSYELL